MHKSDIVYLKLIIFHIDFLSRFDNVHRYIPIALIKLRVNIIEYVYTCLCIYLNLYLIRRNYLILNKSKCKTSMLSNIDMNK